MESIERPRLLETEGKKQALSFIMSDFLFHLPCPPVSPWFLPPDTTHCIMASLWRDLHRVDFNFNMAHDVGPTPSLVATRMSNREGVGIQRCIYHRHLKTTNPLAFFFVRALFRDTLSFRDVLLFGVQSGMHCDSPDFVDMWGFLCCSRLGCSHLLFSDLLFSPLSFFFSLFLSLSLVSCFPHAPSLSPARPHNPRRLQAR